MNEAVTLYGHAEVEARFTALLGQGRMHHAWLLYGMKGIGKRMLADQMARHLVCADGSACGHCHGCRMLAAGSHPDVVQLGLLEGKRDVNIEQVRGLLGFLALSGSETERRVVILDDAERLNHQAANALLKGLEEPAAGSVLMMVCADPERLPATIRSRCMLQQCMPLDEDDVRQVLIKQLADKKGDVDEAVLDLAVDLADGCPGSVTALQDKKTADALLRWRELIADLGKADIGMLEQWIRQQVGSVPHALIVHMLLAPLYPVLQTHVKAASFSQMEALQQAVHECARWPGDVIRSSLRPAPTLLALILNVRSAIRGLTT